MDIWFFLSFFVGSTSSSVVVLVEDVEFLTFAYSLDFILCCRCAIAKDSLSVFRSEIVDSVSTIWNLTNRKLSNANIWKATIL